MALRGRPRGKKAAPRSAALGKALLLNRWMLHQFGVDGLEALADGITGSLYEGWDEQNESRYYHHLAARAFTHPEGVNERQLLEYDRNITAHTLAITGRRGETVKWKYFQYLALLFTEHYLDRYYHDPGALLTSLNHYTRRWNDPADRTVRNESNVQVPLFEAKELNKLAFWMATGSGKTLLMHVNILQHRHWLKVHGHQAVNRVILVTPNEGLTNQHLSEFALSGIDAARFDRSAGSVFRGEVIDVIEITKLKEDHGDKTVAVEAFEQDNLVLVDEGHRGVAGQEWKDRRDQLSRTGFAFEYSATFGQAVSAANGTRRKELLEEYSKSILFDYSYRWFHRDGYGKDYYILNVPENRDLTFTRKYLTGSLLAFYQQTLIWEEHRSDAARFNLAKPLFVFVGSSVNAVRKVGGQETSDVLDIVRFFTAFIGERAESVRHIRELLTGHDGLRDARDQNIFRNRFGYLHERVTDFEAVFDDLLKRFFNDALVGAQVHVDRLKGSDGELGLRVGNAGYFGVVNVGDEKKLYDLCQANGIPGIEKEFAASLFRDINEKGSAINLLIGARKFTEGWSSWRVSCMGLMNIGRSEGSQVIQLFGRGVRLKGYNMSLKRSCELDQDQRPEQQTPAYIPTLETLNVFGIRADYMTEFKRFLEEEGLPAQDSAMEEFLLPVLPTVQLDKAKLKIVQVKADVDFKRDMRVTLAHRKEPGRPPIELDWFPRVQTLAAPSGDTAVVAEAPPPQTLKPMHLEYIDRDAVYLELQRHKNQQAMWNLNLPYEAVWELMANPDWYELLIPASELEPREFKQVFTWQAITTALLKNYIDRFYRIEKAAFESKYMEVVELTPDHPNFQEQFRVEILRSQTEIVRKLGQLRDALTDGSFSADIEFTTFFKALQTGLHLYQPLLYLDAGKAADLISISPVALNDGEMRFVDHLRKHHAKHPAQFEGKRLFLLRNRSRKGIGFFEANNFYPDFILWLIDDVTGIQHVAFVDPKGLRNVNGMDHPKLRFHKVLKDNIEKDLNDPSIDLHSFIVSPTRFEEIRHWRKGTSMQAFNKANVFFMNEQADAYIGMMMTKMMMSDPE
jgi:hypothetical protein